MRFTRYLNALSRRNTSTVAVLVFVALFSAFHYIKPSFAYDRDGSIRNFGINRTKKTVLPLWLVAIVIAVLSYVFVTFSLHYSD